MIRFVAIGHVDTGKSTLCGHLLYKCNYINEHEIEQIQNNGGSWSQVLDIYEEERTRGKTHAFSELSFNYNSIEYSLIDTPGHSIFIREMISGILSDVNIAVVLVSMKQNEFDASFINGTLKEHMTLARAVGIRYLIIIGNKMDLIDWDQEEYNKKIEMVRQYAVKKLKFRNTDVITIPLDSNAGIGLVDTKGYPKWVQNASFIQSLNNVYDLSQLNKGTIKSGKEITSNMLNSKILILNTYNSIITAGYQCIIHMKSSDGKCIELFATIEKIIGKRIAREKDTVDVIFSFEYSQSFMTNERIIIRNSNNHTIGFGMTQ